MADTNKLHALLMKGVVVNPHTQCWERSGYQDKDGYTFVQFRENGKKRKLRAHRVSYELHTGELVDGLVIMHSCDNPCCVNPTHLIQDTQAENNADKLSKKRQPVKFSDDVVEDVRYSVDTLEECAARHGMSIAQVSRIRNGKRRAND